MGFVVVFLFILLNSLSDSVRLGKQEEQVVKATLREFDKAPRNGRFSRLFELPHEDAKLVPKIFIWCPMRHYGLTIPCPVHNQPLRIGHWTDLLDGSRADPRNPRLIYDLNGNLILVQAFYQCSHQFPGYQKAGHHYLSASNEILQLLPPDISRKFPIIMQQRCGFTQRLYDFVISGIYQGQNFMELSEAIASMNFREFMRNNLDLSRESIKEKFDSNVFCLYPGNDKLIDLFLQTFEENKELYETTLCEHTGTVMSCDHTFRTSKYIGITREDGKFTRQFENVFLAINEYGEVMAWRVTKTTATSEIEDMLEGLKERLDRSDVSLKMIIVDDCCHVANFYGRIFPGVKVKLDLFHACMRIVQSIPKTKLYSKKFAAEFSLIFRRNGDLGKERKRSTPCSEEIEANLGRLLFAWNEKLSTETLHQIDNLRKHIGKGCLSDIPPGCGTEMNERLHRHLNRSLLCGVSKIGPELAIAVMTCALYAWNCKRKDKSSQKKRTTPVTPVETVNARNEKPRKDIHMKGTTERRTAYLSSSSNAQKQTPVASVEKITTETTFNYIIQRILHLQDFYTSLTEKCQIKTLDVIALLWSTNTTMNDLIENESILNDIGLDLTDQRNDNLERNLSGFNLVLDKCARDGNCFFTAVSRQLRKHLNFFRDQLEDHCTLLGIGAESEEEDSRILRKLFVKEVLENIDDYKNWMTSSNYLEEVKKFYQDGYFASEVGDLCARAIVRILRIPIVIVTALPTQPTVPFLPHDFITTEPIYIAYDHSGPGHYDATTENSAPDDEDIVIHEIKDRGCTCGKNKERGSTVSCVSEKCPCKKKEKKCTRKCRCHNCTNIDKNTATKETLQIKCCRCGRGSKSKTDPLIQEPCRDGRRKSKCPCVARGMGCTKMCSCLNCANIIQSRIAPTKPKEQRKRKRPTVSPYKRKNGKTFMESENVSFTSGSWKNIEIFCLIICREVLLSHGILGNPSNLRVLYNFVVESNGVKGLSLNINNKSQAQITAKLVHLRDHHKVIP